MKDENIFSRILESACVGLAGGVLFSLLHLPLPWMLGPLAAVAIWRLKTSRPQKWPPIFRKIAMIVFGYLLGASFTPDTAMLITRHLPYMAVTTLTLVFASVLLGWWIARLLKIGTRNGIYGFIPGGFSQLMVVIDGSEKLETTLIAFMQTLRAVTVIFLVPFITMHFILPDEAPLSAALPQSQEPASILSCALYFLLAVTGALVGNYLRLPGAYLVGSLVITAILAGSGLNVPPMPSLLVTLGQVSLGISLGLKIDPKEIRNVAKMLAYTVGTSLLLVLLAWLQAVFLTLLTPIDLKTAFLSTAPGGIAEMGVTAMIVEADLPLVTAYQIFRLFFIMLVVVPFCQWMLSRTAKKQAHADGC